MNILSVEHVKKSYGLRVLFDDVTFAIDGGQKLGSSASTVPARRRS